MFGRTRKPEISSPLPFLGDVKDFDKSKLGKISAQPVKPMLNHPPPIKRSEKSSWKGKDAERYPDECNAQLPRSSDMAGWSLLLERTRSRLVVPFVGAGMSCPLLPGWVALLERVANRLNCPIGERCSSCGQTSEKLPVLTEVLREKLESKWHRSRTRTDKNEGEASGSAKPDFKRQETVVSSELADEFQQVFREAIESSGEHGEAWVEPFLLNGSPPAWRLNAAITRALQLPMALMSGPWPLVLTTNWDTILESAYGLLKICGTVPELDIWDSTHPSEAHFYRKSPSVPVRYRRNVQEIFAELRAGLRPARLLKLHGDFTPIGRHELVAGHMDYRRLMVRGVGITRLLQYIFSNYSMLFYGCSLSDPDLLATLDSMVESLGGEVGPHFWLTADDVSDVRKMFLQRHYSVYTIRTTEAWKFDELGRLLIQLGNKGWPIPRPLAFNALSFTIDSWKENGHTATLSIEGCTPDDVLQTYSDFPVAVALSVGAGRDGRPSAGPQALWMLKGTSFFTSKARFKTSEPLWRSIPHDEDVPKFWLTCGQDISGSGSLKSVFESVQHFVQRASYFLAQRQQPPPNATKGYNPQTVETRTDSSQAEGTTQQSPLKQTNSDQKSSGGFFSFISRVIDVADGIIGPYPSSSEDEASPRSPPIARKKRDLLAPVPDGKAEPSSTTVKMTPANADAVLTTMCKPPSSPMSIPPSSPMSIPLASAKSSVAKDLASLSSPSLATTPGTSPVVVTTKEIVGSPSASGQGAEAVSQPPALPTSPGGSSRMTDSRAKSTEDATADVASSSGDVTADVASSSGDATAPVSARVVEIPGTRTTNTRPATATKPAETKLTGSAGNSMLVSVKPLINSQQPPKQNDLSTEMTNDEKSSMPNKVVLCLPLLSAGGGRLHSQEVLSATVSAIGDISARFAWPCPVHIIVCLATPDQYAQPGRLALMSDIQGGRMCVGDLLSRALAGQMEFTCLVPVDAQASSLLNPEEAGSEMTDQHWRCRRINASLSATMNDLREQMDFLADSNMLKDSSQRLLDANITDGSVIKLDQQGRIS